MTHVGLGKLAINGGTPVRPTPFVQKNMMGPGEREAVLRVMDSGVLSDFLGTWSPQFYGGTEVRALETEWSKYFDVAHAVSVNSATSGLFAAVGAAGVGPGDEVIVSPYTMSASAVAPIVYGGVPVFADIDPDTFCLTAESIRKCITPRTKAVIVVDIFGYPADFPAIMALAREHGITVIEDAAQAPGAKLGGRWAGTLADMGVFSLNYHKTIHSGEGGVIVTNDDALAERLQLIRNHAEVVVAGKGAEDLTNLIGYNYRMTELEASIARVQLQRLDSLLTPRIEAADYLTERLRSLPGLTTPFVAPDVRHGYYLYVMKVDQSITGVSRERLVQALNGEGMDIVPAYVQPIYLQPMYQKRIAIGRHGFPFVIDGKASTVSYDRGICPVVERMHFEELIFSKITHASATRADLDMMVKAFEKVWDNLGELA